MRRALLASLCVVGLWTSFTSPASAGWDNVFQPTLFCHKRQPTTTQYYAAPVVVQSSPVVVAQSAPCDNCAPPPQQCTTNYVQRCYYQPVTTYETRTVQEQVTTYRTSYYYEPVTSYRYSCYYDPCTCSYQQVAVPSTSYMLRTQNCPVQSWVSRCVQVPVTTQQKVCYYQPQTTCCSTTSGAPIYSASPPPSTPAPMPQPPPQAPSITPIMPQTEQPPKIQESRPSGNTMPKANMWDSLYPPIEKAPVNQGSIPGAYKQPQLNPSTAPPTSSPPPPPVRMERIAVGPNSHVEGQVVRNDNSPRPNAKLLFVNAGTGQRQTLLANSAGRFQIDLAPGSWHVYLHGADDIPVHHSRIDVNGAQTRQVNLVSRSN